MCVCVCLQYVYVCVYFKAELGIRGPASHIYVSFLTLGAHAQRGLQ